MTDISPHNIDASEKLTRDHALQLDKTDQVSHLRAEFIIPSKADLKNKTLAKPPQHVNAVEEPCIYLCGNSLGLQPRRTSDRVNSHLSAWATKGVLGHFKDHEDYSLPGFVHIDDVAAEKMAPVVGAENSEVAVMETLTANLHLLMASFYRPTKEKYKIILEGKAFPSDQYAVESQIINRGIDPKDAMVLIEPPGSSSATISTSHILSIIDMHASSTALILLPGIQYYTGQYFDIQKITAHAHTKGLLIGWDLAHAVGNVDLHLHEWDVDFAAWCTYKYINAGPGSIAGLFVHEKHGSVDMESHAIGYRPRLSGWWGGDKSIRFKMGSQFVPIPGARGFQVGNPSALALAALLASLEVFAQTSLSALRTKSIALTGYLEWLLLQPPDSTSSSPSNPYNIITPSNAVERGAQLSILLEPGLLEGVMGELEEQGVVVDERRPDVVRVAPAPLYNTFSEVWEFARIFRGACAKIKAGQGSVGGSVMATEGRDQKGWGKIK